MTERDNIIEGLFHATDRPCPFSVVYDFYFWFRLQYNNNNNNNMMMMMMMGGISGNIRW